MLQCGGLSQHQMRPRHRLEDGEVSLGRGIIDDPTRALQRVELAARPSALHPLDAVLKPRRVEAAEYGLEGGPLRERELSLCVAFGLRLYELAH